MYDVPPIAFAMIALVIGLILLCLGLIISRICWSPPRPKPPPIEEFDEVEEEYDYELEAEESEIEDSKDEMVPVEQVSQIYEESRAPEILEEDNTPGGLTYDHPQSESIQPFDN